MKHSSLYRSLEGNQVYYATFFSAIRHADEQVDSERKQIFAHLYQKLDVIKAASREIENKYNPRQPRVPAGHSDGGQWTDGGGGGSASPSRRKPSRNTAPLKKISSVRTPDGQEVKRANIFVGGSGDSTFGHNVLNSSSLHRDTYGDNYYATNDQDKEISKQISHLPKGHEINLIGHSWGGDTAAKAAVANPGKVRLLITIDPVSISRPDFKKVKGSVGTWVNVYAAGNPESSILENGLQGGLASVIGREWGDAPKGRADIFISAPYNHADFTRMMFYDGGSNSAQAILNRLK